MNILFDSDKLAGCNKCGSRAIVFESDRVWTRESVKLADCAECGETHVIRYLDENE